ncbi:hypothetical protein ID866_9913 [Astraeus odoratus]|nr:hypothetical protein ID866_9913 [Astraeus odoratus]
MFTLMKTFTALLLEKLPHNEYKRVASRCHISAHVTDPTSIVKCVVEVLNIV